MAHRNAPLFCLGADYRTSPLDFLEKLSVSEGEYSSFCGALLEELRARFPKGELAILGTCNRFEIYWTDGSYAELYRGFGACRDDSAKPGGSAAKDDHSRSSGISSFGDEIRRTLAEKTGLSDDEIEERLRFFEGHAAAEHLFRVAAGLESLVIGEHQILGQVEQALSQAVRFRAGGPTLSTVFKAAVHCGRRARQESDIARNPRSVSTVAVQFAESVLGELAGRRVLVIGSGDMGRLTLKALHHRGVTAIDIVNRRLDSAEKLANAWGDTAGAMEQLESLLESADLLITSTASRAPILHPSLVASAMRRRLGRPLVLIDLALPRDIAPEVGNVPGVHLFDLESLKSIADAGEKESREAIPVAERVVCRELDAVRSEFGELAIRPVLSDLWNLADGVRSEVMANARSSVQGLDPAQWQEVERLTRLLTNKLLHRPSALLRREATNGRAVEYANLVAELFGLNGVREDRPPETGR